jgi:hypothetical protein
MDSIEWLLYENFDLLLLAASTPNNPAAFL